MACVLINIHFEPYLCLQFSVTFNAISLRDSNGPITFIFIKCMYNYIVIQIIALIDLENVLQKMYRKLSIQNKFFDIDEADKMKYSLFIWNIGVVSNKKKLFFSTCNCITDCPPCFTHIVCNILFVIYMNLPLHIPATLSQYLLKSHIEGIPLKTKIQTNRNVLGRWYETKYINKFMMKIKGHTYDDGKKEKAVKTKKKE